MADTPSRKRSWRNADAPAPTSPPVEAAWRKPKGPARQSSRWWKSRGVQLGFVIAAVFGVAVGIFAVVLWWNPHKPIYLMVVRADYQNNLFVPPNVAGRNGVDELERLAEERRPLDSHFEDAVKELVQKAPKKVVLFITAHGVARIEDGNWVPYLVPEDADLRSETPLYPLDRLLDAMSKLPENTSKLLLLDVTGVNAHWPLGELHNDFARALENRAGRIKNIKNLVVISSSDKDQSSWAAPEWGQTYFAHFVIEGLKGAADLKSEKGDGDGRVDALELYRYLQNHVKRWVWQNRQRPQAPVLFGGEDDQRARGMELVTYGDYEASHAYLDADNDKLNQDYKDTLQVAWEKCRELRKTTPHPAAYTPQLWRRYLDVLLRAETLWRSGNAPAAKTLLADLEDLQRRIERSRSLELKSAQLTLAMPAALGWSGDGVKILPPEVLAYLQKGDAAKKEDKDKAIEALKKFANDPRRRQLAGAALTDALYHKIADDPKRVLDREDWLLGLVDPEAPNCRSAEAHYLMMLADNPAMWRSQGEANWPLLQQSLRLRLRAEQAALGLKEDKAAAHLAAYSEQVLPWIQSMIDKADAPRRLGQDLLFASAAEEGNKAKKLFDEGAGPGYAKAQELAVKIRRALDVRDRLYAELPYYTHWIAESGSGHEDEVVNLWNELHELRRLLEKPVSGDAGMTRAAQLDERQQRLTEGFKKLHGWLEEIAANKENPSTQNRWHEIEAALAVPFLEPETRRNLIHNSRKISRDLFEESPKHGDAEIPNREAGPTLAQESARLQGRLALAMLSADDWPEEYARVKNALDVPEEGAWYRSTARAGQDIGRFLNRLPELADKQCQEAARKDNLDDAGEALKTAARYARTIEGAAAVTRMTRNPLDEQHRLGLHDLLCWQAHRTFLDWWAELGQPPQMPAYFQRAGAIFLADAEQLLMGQAAKANPAARSPRLKRIDAERENLRQPVQMVVQRSQRRSKEDFRAGPAQFHLTDEDNVEWFYRLLGPKSDQLHGQPVAWVKADRGLRVAAADASRRTTAFGDSFAVNIAEDYAAGRPADGAAKHHVWGFFRGHRSESATSIFMPVRPDRVVSLPPLSGRGHVAVQTKRSLYDLYGAENTAIALLLDCSGSMEYVPMPNSRFKRAVKAMRTVLKELPKGVTVSLRTFGAEQFQDNDTNKYGIKLVWPAAPWDPEKLDSLMGEIAKLKPRGPTPLVRSIAAAKKDLPGDKKTRSIVVITDGGDSTFYKDENLREGDNIKNFLRRQFADSDIQISVIGFEAKELPEEEKAGDREFRQALKDMQGQYYNADGTDRLMEYLARSLLHMYFQVYPDVGRDVVDQLDKGENISQSDKNWRWVHLEPDTYRIRIPSIRSLKQSIEVRSGDALLLDLVRGLGGRPEFRRGIYAESDYITLKHSQTWTDKKSQKEWLLAVLQNHQLEGSKQLQLMATLEKYPRLDRSPDRIQQVHPRWVWFDVPAPMGANTSPTLRITSLPDYPADAWGLDVSDWPINRPSAALKTWWIEHSPRPRARLFKGQDFETPLDLRPRPWLDDPQLGKVDLAGVELKRCNIQVEDRNYKDVNCLVVRLNYPPDKEPFFVRLSDNADRKMGVEDRFYTQSGKYTGLFWPASEKMLQNIERLELFSVAALKNQQESLRVDKLELSEPSDRYKRPPSVGAKNEEP